MAPKGNSTAGTLVSASRISKTYGRFTALHDVAFSIRPKEILGLIGPNGAGKTTLFECLAGIQPADSMTLSFTNGASRSETLFYVPDGIVPWPDQSVRWALDFFVGFFGGRQIILDEIIVDLGLDPLLRASVRALSKGQRKRVLLALGLLAPQPIVVIDEPFEGLDLRQSREASATLRKHAANGRTLFVSIHQIGDAAKVCERFILLSNGRVAGEGTLPELALLARDKIGAAPPDDFEEIFLALT